MKDKKVLIVKNISHEDAGLFEDILKENNIRYDIVDLSIGERFPNPKGYSAIMVFGGPDSANDDTQKMKDELKRIEETVDAKIPFLGICLGLQTLVKAMGGSVRKNGVKEVGCRDTKGNFFDIKLTKDGKNDPIFRDLDPKLRTFHLHGETVDILPEMTLLATGEYCKNQAVRIGKNAYGLQGHFELTKSKLKIWMANDEDLKKTNSETLLKDYNNLELELELELENNARKIFANFLKISNLTS